MRIFIVAACTALLFGCVSQTYCSDEKYAAEKERFNYAKCSAAVAADVVLVTVMILGAAGAAQNNSNNSSSYTGNCACPGDLDAQGNRCGLRSAYSRAGGAEPYCEGRM